jgi:uncharacterized glyoxalase superfamily protein PhnB
MMAGVSFKPQGWHSVTPRLFASDPAALVEFLRAVFDADGAYRPGSPAEMRIGDSIVMVSGDEVRSSTSACLYVYLEDADASYARAMTAGAESMESPRNMPYGDRRAMVRDPWGNVWQIATQLRQR